MQAIFLTQATKARLAGLCVAARRYAGCRVSTNRIMLSFGFDPYFSLLRIAS